MATNMAPHNLVEVIGAARHLIAHPDCSLDDLMKFVPGPDLPGGGRIIGLDGIRDAYLTGRGSFRTRATARVEKRSPRAARASSSPSCPTWSAPRRSSSKIKDLVQAKKLQGIADVKDLTDRKHGLRLVIEVKNGFNPDAVLEQLYRLTPMEDSFGINNVALVDGQPRTLGLKDLLRGLRRLPHRRRAAAHRSTGCAKREERLHLVEGLLIAILDIDEVIQLIRGSDDAATAKARLMDVFDLSEVQADLHPRPAAAPADQVLPDRAGDRAGRAASAQIEELEAILGDEKLLLTHRVDRAGRRRQGPRHPAPDGAAGVGRYARVRSATAAAARGRRRPVLGAAVVDRAARPHPHRRPAAERGRPGQARRHRRGGPHDRPRRGRAGDLAAAG